MANKKNGEPILDKRAGKHKPNTTYAIGGTGFAVGKAISDGMKASKVWQRVLKNRKRKR